MPIVISNNPAIVTAKYQVVDVRQIIAGNDSIILPYFISECAIATLTRNHEGSVYDLCFSHDLLYHSCCVMTIKVLSGIQIHFVSILESELGESRKYLRGGTL